MFKVELLSAEKVLEGLSLRDAHKRRTSNLLRQTALRMFRTNGYDATTAEDIADKAGVSVRTFFRYFATKDEVVFKGQGAWAKAVVVAYLRQPEALSDMHAMCEALIEAASGMDRKSVVSYGRTVENSQMLRGRAAELIAISTREIALAVTQRQGLSEADTRARLFTEVAVAIYQAAVKDWRDGKDTGSLENVIGERFRRAAALFGVRT